MQFGPDDGGEIVGAEGPGVGHRPVEIADEMFRQHHEVVAGVLVGLDHLVRLEAAVGQVGMGVEIAAPEAAGSGKGGKPHGKLLVKTS